MKILYFAWLRQKIGVSREEIDPPSEINTLGELIRWLKGQSPGHADAFLDETAVHAAINHEFATTDVAIKPGDEIAFFPPITGG